MFAPKVARPQTTAAARHGDERARPPTKLTLGRTDDPLEREADRLADQVMRTSDAAVRPRMRDAGAARPGPATDLLSGPGRALDRPTRTFFEPRFGFSLSQVRLHADDQAARSAAAIGARAFAAGHHIGFAANQYEPATAPGRRLLAHELAHVAQSANAPGAEMVVRRTPADPVRYDTGTQTFRPPAAGDTVASVKADIATKQAMKPDPDLGPNVDVKGAAAGQPEELYVWNALLQRGSRRNWGTEIQVVTDIGPTPATPPDAQAPVGKITIIIDKKGSATAELLDKGPVAVPAAFADKDKAVAALKTDFGFASVDDGTGAWTPGDLNKVHAALSQLSAADRAALSGVALVRDSTLTDSAGKPRDGEFRHSHLATPGSAGTLSVASRDESLHLATSAFNADAKGFVGEKGKEVLPSLRVIVHEAGHAIETKALRDAEFATDTAQAQSNNDNFAFAAEQTSTGAAVTAANAEGKAAFASANSYRGPIQTAARPFTRAFQAALNAINTFANNTTGSRFAALETTATKAIAARDAAKAALPASHPALTDFAAALTAQDAWFAQAQVRATASLKLDASKADVVVKTKAQAGASDATGKASKRLAAFVAVVNANKIQPLTKYAKDNWPGTPDEFFAEAYSLWQTNPAYLNDNAPALKAWFDAGNHLK